MKFSTDLYYCRLCIKEIDRHIFAHWLLKHNWPKATVPPTYDHEDAQIEEQQSFYWFAKNYISYSRKVELSYKPAAEEISTKAKAEQQEVEEPKQGLSY